MKNFLLFLICLSTCSLFSQEETNSGKKNILGGSFFFRASKNGQIKNSLIFTPSGPVNILGDETTFTNFFINPYYARKLSEGWLLGIVAGYNLSVLRFEDDFRFRNQIKQTNNTFNIGIFGRYTFFPGNKFSMFFQPGINYVRSDRKLFVDGDQFEHTRSYSVDVLGRPGAAYKIGYNFQLIATFGEIGVSFGNERDQDGNSPTIDFSSFYTDFGFSSFALGAEMRF